MKITDIREGICICGEKLVKFCNSPVRVSAPYAPQDEIWVCNLCAKYFMKAWRAGNIDYYTEKADYQAVFDELTPTLRLCVTCKSVRGNDGTMFQRLPVCKRCFILKEWESRFSRGEVARKFPFDAELHDFMAGERALEEREYIEALEKIRPFAEAGFSLAEYNMGEIYENAFEDLQDIPKALEWYKKAARKQFPSAFFRIGKIYSEQHKTGIDLVEAYKWFNLGAHMGDISSVAARAKIAAKMPFEDVLKAQAESIRDLRKYWIDCDFRRRILDKLKEVYGEQEGPCRFAEILEGEVFQTFVLDYKESERLFRKLADDRYSPAMCRLGEKLVQGHGVEANPDEAGDLLATAISRGWLPAIEFAWVSVSEGSQLKLERDWLQAKFFEKIEAGNTEAIYNWGMINFKGRGIPVNLEEAHKWLNLAQYFGQILPQPSPLETIERQMSYEQLEKILDDTQKWLDEHQSKIRFIANNQKNLLDRLKTEGATKWFNLGESFLYGKEGFLRHTIFSYGLFDLAYKAGNIAAASRMEFLSRILTSAKTENAINATSAFVKAD